MEIPVSLHFPTFLDDQEVYHTITSFWAQVLEEHLPADKSEWYPFYQNKGQDGNPIFSAWLPKQRKLLRIIQFLPAPGDTLFSPWIDEWQGAWPESLSPPNDLVAQAVPELVLDLALTPETIQLAQTLIYMWVQLDHTSTQLEKLWSKSKTPFSASED